MENFTYENNNRTNKYEKYEWDQVWIEDTDNTTSTRVLYIGDSISCNVRCLATKQSKEEFLFDGFGTSKSLDNKYFKDSLTLFSVQLPKTDIVIFNNGTIIGHFLRNAKADVSCKNYFNIQAI